MPNCCSPWGCFRRLIREKPLHSCPNEIISGQRGRKYPVVPYESSIFQSSDYQIAEIAR
jgi:hypothetical protein